MRVFTCLLAVVGGLIITAPILSHAYLVGKFVTSGHVENIPEYSSLDNWIIVIGVVTLSSSVGLAKKYLAHD